jgi:hypothetical protein
VLNIKRGNTKPVFPRPALTAAATRLPSPSAKAESIATCSSRSDVAERGRTVRNAVVTRYAVTNPAGIFIAAPKRPTAMTAPLSDKTSIA